MTKVHTKRICSGYYETVNTSPVAYISKNSDDENWTVSFERTVSVWKSKKECMGLIECVSDNVDDFDEEDRIIITKGV